MNFSENIHVYNDSYATCAAGYQRAAVDAPLSTVLTTLRVWLYPFVCVCCSVPLSLLPFQPLAAVVHALSFGVSSLPTIASFALTPRLGSVVALHFPWLILGS